YDAVIFTSLRTAGENDYGRPLIGWSNSQLSSRDFSALRASVTGMVSALPTQSTSSPRKLVSVSGTNTTSCASRKSSGPALKGPETPRASSGHKLSPLRYFSADRLAWES